MTAEIRPLPPSPSMESTYREVTDQMIAGLGVPRHILMGEPPDMVEEQTFLAAIIAEPEDAIHRLVFADWLDDRDDPRADHLRYQGGKEPSYWRVFDLREWNYGDAALSPFGFNENSCLLVFGSPVTDGRDLRNILHLAFDVSGIAPACEGHPSITATGCSSGDGWLCWDCLIYTEFVNRNRDRDLQ